MNDWSVIALDRSMGAHAAQWDALNESRFKGNPMLSSRFVNTLLKHFGDGTERLCILRTLGEVKAMCVLRPRSPGIWASFLPAQAQIGPSLVEQPDTIQPLFQVLPGYVTQIDILCNDPEFGDLSVGTSRQRECRDHALTINISPAGDFAQFWSARPTKLAQNIGRYERRLSADNLVPRMDCITQPAAMHAALSRYAALESRGWKGTRGTALGIDNAQGRFYLELVTQYAESAQACVYELWLGDRLAASRLTINAGQTMVMLKTTYDEELSRYAPGRLLMHRAIQDAYLRFHGGSIEFYTDANADQLAWANGQRWIRHITFYRTPAMAILYMLLRTLRSAWIRPSGIETALALQAESATVDVYRHPREFPADVRRLFDADSDRAVEASVAWYRNLVDTVFPRHDGVRFYVLRHAGQPVAALPILVERRAGGNHARALANYYTTLYSPVVKLELKAAALAPLLTAVCATHAPLHSLSFAPMDPQSRAYRLLRHALQLAGLAPFQYFCFGNWFLRDDVLWPAYLTGRDGKLRSTIKRMTKKFAADGGTLEVVVGGADLERAILAYERVYAGSWKVPEPFPEFVPGLARICAENGWLRLGVAWLHDEPIAAQIWIVASGTANIYKVAYHESYKAYAPGTLVTARLMEHVMAVDRVAEVDYLIGDDPYKKTWMNSRRERWGIVAHNPRTALGILGLCRELAGQATKWLRERLKRRASVTES